MFERFTDEARAVVVTAQEEARGLQHNYIGTEHLLLGLVGIHSGAAQVLRDAGMTRDGLHSQLVATTGHGESDGSVHVPFTPRAKKVLELALREALSLAANHISPDHLLLGLLREADGVAAQLLVGSGADPEKLRRQLLDNQSTPARDAASAPAGAPAATPGSRGKQAALDKYGTNLTELARTSQLDPVVGRDAEISRLLRVLVRRSKNNPVLVGEPGVGKTAVVEGLAQRIAADEVPSSLRGTDVISLDVGAMLAGARYRGDFEERLKAVLRETTSRDDVVLFVDEVHTLVGAGASEGAVDAAALLKPLLARRQLRMIGATTTDEYRKSFEKDAALVRRFQPITIDEPSHTDTIEILTTLKPRLEAHHDVEIDPSAVDDAVSLSARYIADRQLPDKAVDLLDEACALVRIDAFDPQRELLLVDRETAKADLADAEHAGSDDGALRASQAQRRIDELDAKLAVSDKPQQLSVDAGTVAQLVQDITGVPVAERTGEQARQLLQLESALTQRVVGQDTAVSAVARAVRRAQAGLKSPQRPAGSFLFAGPSGVGKTELAKALAEQLLGSAHALLTLDMSEYAEEHAVARLFGSPPGYVGHEAGGQLTEQVRRKPYSVVLLDEVEKAHPEVFNTLLQVLEEGRMTDGKGREVDFTNTVLVMTSNLGTTASATKPALGFAAAAASDERAAAERRIHAAVQDHFRPEFLNRLDETVVFAPLQAAQMHQILDLLLADTVQRANQLGVELTMTAAARDWFAEHGYDPQYGARPLRRLLQRRVEDPLADRILDGQTAHGGQVTVDVVGGEVLVTAAVAAAADTATAAR